MNMNDGHGLPWKHENIPYNLVVYFTFFTALHYVDVTDSIVFILVCTYSGISSLQPPMGQTLLAVI